MGFGENAKGWLFVVTESRQNRWMDLDDIWPRDW